MRWNIVTDSSCDLPPAGDESELVRVSSVPFVISVGEKDFIDDVGLDTESMLRAMEQSKSASHTSCPTPQSWIEEFEKADQSIAITISRSCPAACTARELLGTSLWNAPRGKRSPSSIPVPRGRNLPSVWRGSWK